MAKSKRHAHEVEILDVLRSVVAVNGSQKETARVLCISPQYLCDILKGRREVSAEVAESLGCERVVTYIDRWKKDCQP